MCVGALALASLGGAAAPVHAEGGDRSPAGAPRRVVLDASACSEVSVAALRRIVAIEIGDLLVGAGESASDETDRVTIACGGAEARVEADGPNRPQRLRRTLRLDEFPGDAAPRALALAAIEILAALSPDVRQRIEGREAAPAPPPPPPPPAASVKERVPPPAAPRASTTVLAAAVRRAFLTDHGVSVWGARLGLRRDLGLRLELAVDAELASGSAPASTGSITSTLGSAGLAIGLRGGSSRLAGGVAAGGRVGFARLQGEPASGSGGTGERATRAWGGPLLAARAATGGRHVGVEVAAELGYDLGMAHGSDAGAAGVAVAVGGPWLLVSAAIAVQF
jgi:hypothetical protein